MSNPVVGFLADTCWFAFSQRFSERKFRQWAVKRSKQGFTAVQVVVGIPPEVGPKNINALSDAGFPWSMSAEVNLNYLQLVRKRIIFLNKLGITAIAYGAWGYQIEWQDKKFMCHWWSNIINELDDLKVIYCLTGEIDLYLNSANRLLMSKTTDQLIINKMVSRKMVMLLGKLRNHLQRLLPNDSRTVRVSKWEFVLSHLSRITKKPILIHTTSRKTAFNSVSNYHLLAANTVQTGHNEQSRDDLWKIPIEQIANNPKSFFINLEPWYEGIKDSFWVDDQLFAYWVSMLAGSSSYCYGAHGIWNIGDGKFLSHWGKQSFDEALALDTPRLIGLSHQELMKQGKLTMCSIETKMNNALQIKAKGKNGWIHYYSDASKLNLYVHGKIWLPHQGTYTDRLPKDGQVVIFEYDEPRNL